MKKKEQSDSYTERPVKTWKKIQYKNMGKEVHPSQKNLETKTHWLFFSGTCAFT